jgi:hypothetical protein
MTATVGWEVSVATLARAQREGYLPIETREITDGPRRTVVTVVLERKERPG